MLYIIYFSNLSYSLASLHVPLVISPGQSFMFRSEHKWWASRGSISFVHVLRFYSSFLCFKTIVQQQITW